jgi:hypothetical protein
MNHLRLDITNSGLNLDYFSKEDTLGLLIEKLNRNFREILANGGGPLGQPGKQGPPGCSGLPGPPGKDGESELEWVGRIAKVCDLSTYDELHSVNDIITNKYTNRTLLLSNLEEVFASGDSILRLRSIDEEELTALRVSTELNDFKMKIYSSDDDGLGKHIHLMNSKAASIDSRFFCKSGYTIAVDWNGNNVETLKIKAEENSLIENHTQNVEIQGDILKLKRTETSQEFNFESGNKASVVDPINDPRRLTKRLVDLTGARVQSISDRTGYEAVWQDTLNHSEEWEIIESTDLRINHARYEFLDGSLINVNRPEAQLVMFDETSVVRFKRMNNWVLVDFHIGLISNDTKDEFYIRNFQIKIMKDIVGCLTLGWHPNTVMESENYLDDDFHQYHGFFKIDSTDFDNKTNNTFIISNKFASTNKILLSTSTINNYWFSGQVFATVQNPDCSVITLDIQQQMSCPELNIDSL